MDRRTLGGWLEGPGGGRPDTTQDYKGQLLGLPPAGKGAVAGVGRRLGAITIDWFAAVFISRLLFPGVDYATQASSIVVLGTFALVVTVLTWLSGASLGQRLLGIQVVRLGENPRPGLGIAIVRTLLLSLVIPAVIFDRDQRGLHDKAVGTVVLNAR